MRTAPLVLVTLLLSLALAGAAGAAYVQRLGKNLTLASKSFHFVGHNNYQLTSMAGSYVCGRALSDATVNQILQDSKNAGATVIRTWFFQSYYRGGDDRHRAVRRGRRGI